MKFLKKIKIAVLNFEKYQIFAKEETITAIKYFFIIMLLFAIFSLFAILYPVIDLLKKGVEYIETNIPDFSISDGTLSIETDEPIIAKNEDLSLILYINIHASAEDAQTFFEENKGYNNVVLLSEKNLYGKFASFAGIVSEEYKTIADTINIGEISKQNIIDYFNNSGYFKIYISIFLVTFMYYFVVNIALTLVIDVLILTLLGMIATKLYKVNLTYKNCFNMAIYALTLPIILKTLYIIVNSLTGFTVEYFEIMYKGISYVYIVTAILMMRDENDKTASDLMKIETEIKKNENEEEVTKEVEDDEKEKEKEEKEKKKDEEKENNKRGAPEPNPGKA